MSCASDISVVERSNNPLEGIEVRGSGDLTFTKVYEPGKIVWLGEINVYAPPVISAIANPLKEVGDTIDFEWTVEISAGRDAITSKTIDPVPDPAPNMDLPFDVTITDKKVTSRQTVVYHTVEASDGTETTERELAVTYANKVHLLFTYKDGVTPGQEITESDIALATSTLAVSIKTLYGGLKTYTVPSVGVLQYIYWIYESGTTPINSMELGGVPFPLTFIPGVVAMDNPHDAAISVNYALVRSSNKFGNGPISIDML